MNDDTPFLSAELASAYLDNEATPDERARVEASADLRSQVAALVELRARLVDVAPVESVARESALAAAMAVFGVADVADAIEVAGEADVADTPAVVAPVVSLAARRQKMYRVITGVAAASVLTLGGLAALNGMGGSDEKSSQAAVESPDTSVSAKIELAAPADTTAAADADPASADAALGGSAPAEMAAPADSAPANDQMATESVAGADAFADLPPIADPDELAAYASTPAADRVRSTVVSIDACPASTMQYAGAGAEPIGEVSYAGEPALVVRRADGSVQAISLLSCAVLTQIPPP